MNFHVNMIMIVQYNQLTMISFDFTEHEQSKQKRYF